MIFENTNPRKEKMFPVFLTGLITVICLTVLKTINTNWVREFSLYTTSVFFESLGFVLIGCLVGSLIETYLDSSILLKLSEGHRISGFFLSALAGIVFPVCECAIVPVVKSLIRKGMPPAMGITFLLSVPIVNPVVGLFTYLAFNGSWQAAGLRLLTGYMVSVMIGLSTDFILKDKIIKTSAESVGSCSCGHNHTHETCGCGHDHEIEQTSGEDKSFLRELFRLTAHSWNEFLHIAPYFITGICAASLSRSLFNFKALQGLFNHEGLSSLFMMGGAFALNLCSEADAFVGASFRSIIPGAAIFSFLVYGPMMDLKLLAMYQSLFFRRTSVFLFAAVTLFTSCATLIISLLNWGGFFGL